MQYQQEDDYDEKMKWNYLVEIKDKNKKRKRPVKEMSRKDSNKEHNKVKDNRHISSV